MIKGVQISMYAECFVAKTKSGRLHDGDDDGWVSLK